MQWRDREGREPAAIAALAEIDGKHVLEGEEARGEDVGDLCLDGVDGCAPRPHVERAERHAG